MAKGAYFSLAIILLLTEFFPQSSAQKDTLSHGAFLLPDQKLVSSGGTFALGFFSPGPAGAAGGTRRYYAGIWYNGIPERTVVWVANRNSPLKRQNSSSAVGSLTVLADGTAAVLDGRGRKVWATGANVSIRQEPTQNATLTLLDSGDLRLTGGNGDLIWRSFDHPTDTLLPTMELTQGVPLVSWRNASDPSDGDFYIEMDKVSPLQLLLRRRGNNETLLRYGLWGDRKAIQIPGINTSALHTEAIVVDRNNGGRTYYTFSVSDTRVLLRLYVNPADPVSGEFKVSAWNALEKKWKLEVGAPYPPCEVFNRCGPNGVCNRVRAPQFCSCLDGFQPKEPAEWSAGNFSGGCVRRDPIAVCRDGNTFVKVPGVRLPDEFVFLKNRTTEADCAAECASSCSCNAYAYRNYSGWDVVDVRCLLWHGDLKDMVVDALRGGDLYLRVSRTGSSYDSKRKRLLLIILPSVAGLILCVAVGFTIRKRLKRIWFSTIIDDGTSFDNRLNVVGRENTVSDAPFIDFKTILAATDSFSFANKLGQGGFGPVYKGRLMTGQDIAVKRLSDRSKQGFKEFKNEVELIGQVQHTNLVRLLGWCMSEDEKILVYEYLPNKSLDKYIFDENLSAGLKWSQRYCIIQGIAQGLLYLHRFSRVRIIHRDLKTSNILLDGAMNPKISDFGLARIFGSNQTEGNTDKAMGTYGYMSPEYAMRGFFSEKSDVFSFGVMVLEIISGKRSTGYDLHSDSFCLLQFLSNEGRGQELVDLAILSSVVMAEVEACIHIGLLCVQADPADRPDISTVISMLGNKTADFPRPMQPAYVVGNRLHFPATSSSATSGPSGCSNDISNSVEAGR